jgi:hypothetical protein
VWALWLLSLLARSADVPAVPRNMMTLMLASLTYVLWFVVLPFAALIVRG